MAGGTFTTQNKVRPGVYIRFKTNKQTGLTVSDRGVVAICEPLSWGPIGEVNEIESGADVTPYTGYDITNTKNRFLQELFKGSNRTPAPIKVLLYRPSATSSAKATATITDLTVTARYDGARGNDITIVISALTGGSFTVDTVIDGSIVDEQTGALVGDLVDNDWVKFSGTATDALVATTGTALTGGADGTIASSAYSAFLTAIEPHKFDVIVYDGSDATTKTAMIAFVKRIANENGQYTQLVASGLTNPDSRFVINVESGVTLSDGTVLSAAETTWWVAGATAGARFNQSLTYASYPDAVKTSPVMTNSQYIAALNAGKFVLFEDNGVVKVEQDIDSLVTYTQEIGKPFRKNRVMRLCNTIANDIFVQFSQNYIGIVNNNADGRALFRAAIVGYLQTIQAEQGIQNFEPDDVTVDPGEDIDAIVVNIAIQPVDAVEKIYVTIELN